LIDGLIVSACVPIAVAWTCVEPIADVEFAPNLGRSQHFLAVASKRVHILAIKPPEEHL